MILIDRAAFLYFLLLYKILDSCVNSFEALKNNRKIDTQKIVNSKMFKVLVFFKFWG